MIIANFYAPMNLSLSVYGVNKAFCAEFHLISRAPVS